MVKITKDQDYFTCLWSFLKFFFILLACLFDWGKKGTSQLGNLSNDTSLESSGYPLNRTVGLNRVSKKIREATGEQNVYHRHKWMHRVQRKRKKSDDKMWWFSWPEGCKWHSRRRFESPGVQVLFWQHQSGSQTAPSSFFSLKKVEPIPHTKANKESSRSS